MVRLTGIEPARRKTLDPKSSASANSATGAFRKKRNHGSDSSYLSVSTLGFGPRTPTMSR